MEMNIVWASKVTTCLRGFVSETFGMGFNRRCLYAIRGRQNICSVQVRAHDSCACARTTESISAPDCDVQAVASAQCTYAE